MQKTAAPETFTQAGTTITYSYLVTNAGNVTLTSIGVTDPMPKLSTVSCPDTSLAPNISETCTATYTTTQTDVDNGQLQNTGTATGTAPGGGTVSDSSSATVPAVQTVAIGLTKTPDQATFDAAGTLITYTLIATNTGNVTLHGITVTDAMTGLTGPDCPTLTPDTTLAPSQSLTCTATYSTTQADLDGTGVVNTAIAEASSPQGTNTSDTATATVSPVQDPAISLVKTANPPDFSTAGTVITYRYELTNSGNVTLTSVGVTDLMVGLSTITCPSSTLAPAASETCTATYTTTNADVQAGHITNTATGSGTPPTGPPVETDPAALTLLAAEISLVKSADTTFYDQPGQAVIYSYMVTNTGTATLTDVAVTDPMPGLSAITCPDTTLAPNATMTCTATYTTTAADVQHGSITNVGTASGTPSANGVVGPPVTATSTVTIPGPKPAISLVKTASISSFSAPGTKVTYTYKVTNTGNVPLTSVTVTDPMPGLSALDCNGVTTLNPGASATCTATYSTTQSNVDAGKITNTGTASGDPPSGPAVTSDSTVTVAAAQKPGLSLTKTASLSNFATAGTPITYRYHVTNTGNVTVTALTVTDAMAGLSAISCPVTTLAPGASVTCTATYTTTTQDLANGKITNTATASGKDPAGTVTSTASSVTIPDVPGPNPPPPPAPESPVTPAPVPVTG